MYFIDTDIMIDILKDYKPAIEWLKQISDEEIALSGLVVMELMAGCQNKAEMEELLKKLTPYSIRWHTQDDCERAIEFFPQVCLSDNIGIIDALIGECAVGRQVPLCTFNVKHFKVVPNLRTIQPYPKVTQAKLFTNSNKS